MSKDKPIGVKAPPLGQMDNPKAQRLVWALGYAPPGDVVEVGCQRTPTELPSDGWSTVYLARASEEAGRLFYSFDIDEQAVAIANQALEARNLWGRVECKGGLEALLEHPDPIGFLYLDGSNDPAEALGQLQSAKLAPGAVLAVDDVQMLDWNALHGKATLIVPWLRELGIAFDIYKTLPGYSMLVARMP